MKAGDRVFLIPEFDSDDVPVLEDLKLSMECVLVEAADGALYAVHLQGGVAKRTVMLSQPYETETILPSEYSDSTFAPTLREALLRAAKDERDYADKCSRLSDAIEALAENA